MINSRVLIPVLIALCTITQPILSNSSLVVVLMVKDEELFIEKTLEPFVKGGIERFLLYDTGSRDKTVQVATEFFNVYHLDQAHILEDPFVDFATSRNRALDAAEHLFPDATFIIMPDAEWYIQNIEILLSFCDSHLNDVHDSYALYIKSDVHSFITTRLIRCHKNIRFVGAVHEALNQITTVTLPEECYFKWGSSPQGRIKSTLRWQQDLDLLLKEYAIDPENPRTLFYLGQTYHCLGDLDNAYLFYEKRTKIIAWDEENFMALLKLGDVAYAIAQSNNEQFYSIAIHHYLEAFNLRPHRAEPLIRIAHYYLNQNKMHAAFLFAQHACAIPYPTGERLFVDRSLYELGRYAILSQCAWYVQKYEIGEWAAKQAFQAALKSHPDLLQLQRNIQFYTDRHHET